MRIPKSQIRISGSHPSLLLDLAPGDPVVAPVVLDQSGLLVDGYRRFRIEPSSEVPAVTLDVPDVFRAAVAMNLRTRLWDEVDGLLWSRWADSLGVSARLPETARFAPELKAADDEMLRHLASRQLAGRQVVLVLQAPPAYRSFFLRFLAETVRLNNNETRDFIEMGCDLKKILRASRMEDVFREPSLAAALAESELDKRRKGERLLKEMRVLRYPNYQRKSDEFSQCWTELDLGRRIRADRSHFLERGKLEITVTSESHQEMKESVERWARRLNSPSWRKIWEE